jgi:hypothetical protein
MSLTYEEVESCLLRIFTSEEYVDFNKGSEQLSLVFRQPSNSIKLRANVVYNKTYKEAVDSGLLPLDKLEELLISRQVFTEEDQVNIDKLESKLAGQKVLLSKTTKVKAHSDRIKRIISEYENQINEIKYKKYSKLIMSAETKAEEDKHAFLCSACTFNVLTNELYWNNVSMIMLETDLNFKEEVMRKFLKFYNGIDTKSIRFLARHALWRIRYVSSQKISDSLFGVPTSQYTNDQLNLVYWSNYYQNIYEMLSEDRPSDLIIEDDESLDAYMTSYYEERNREDSFRRSKKDSGGNMSALDKEEVIITRSNELYQDIKYDKPKEAQQIKDRSDIKKRTRRL